MTPRLVPIRSRNLGSEVSVRRRYHAYRRRYRTQWVLLTLCLFPYLPGGALGQPACFPPANAIVAENCRTDGVVDRAIWDSQR